MPLTELRVKNVRNLADVQLSLNRGISIFEGPNGSGKTSLLEAIYLLGTAKSFRSHQIDKIIRKGEHESLVYGKVEDKKSVIPKNIGVKRSRTGIELKKDAVTIKNRSLLASTLPLVVITPNSHQLLESGPQWRRRFIDWGVFHVKHNFASDWSKYQRLLKQRNTLLSKNEVSRIELGSWDVSFIEFAQKITQLRKDYIVELTPYIQMFLTKLLAFDDLTIKYYPGHSGKESDFSDQLRSLFHKEKKLGRTEIGPHRADVKFFINGVDAKSWVSRGQQKMLLYVLILAQNRYLRELTNKEPTLLLDDLSAELDHKHLDRLLNLLEEEFSQVLITTANINALPTRFVSKASLFHVEHGSVKFVH